MNKSSDPAKRSTARIIYFMLYKYAEPLHTNWLYPASRNTYTYCNKKKPQSIDYQINNSSNAAKRSIARIIYFVLYKYAEPLTYKLAIRCL